MNTKQAKEIVPPEPHSTGPDFRKAWNYMPRWLQIIVVLAFIVAGISVVIFTKRYEMKARAETQAQAKRETTYQAALRSYSQILKPGMKRKEVEDYLRVNKTEFFQLSLDDLTKIGEDAPTWYCGPSGVYVKFQFIGVRPLEPRLEANDEDTLDEIKIFHWGERCL